MTPFKTIEIIINPASGNNEPILNTVNDVLKDNDNVAWHVSVTQPQTNGTYHAKEALKRGVDLVMAYGGDGTIHEVAQALIGTNTPLCILPGGTGNALAKQLGIPLTLADALALALTASPTVKAIDTGLMGDHIFVLNAGTGLYNALLENADRDMKDRFGGLAYVLSSLKAIAQPEKTRYTIQADETRIEEEAIACMIANTSALGTLGLSLPKFVVPDDGLFDIFLVSNRAKTLLDTMSTITDFQPFVETMHHWQARKITIESTPATAIFVDGESHEASHTPVVIEVQPQSLHIVVP